jgi:hypothetical protein
MISVRGGIKKERATSLQPFLEKLLKAASQ